MMSEQLSELDTFPLFKYDKTRKWTTSKPGLVLEFDVRAHFLSACMMRDSVINLSEGDEGHMLVSCR